MVKTFDAALAAAATATGCWLFAPSSGFTIGGLRTAQPAAAQRGGAAASPLKAASGGAAVGTFAVCAAGAAVAAVGAMAASRGGSRRAVREGNGRVAVAAGPNDEAKAIWTELITRDEEVRDYPSPPSDGKFAAGLIGSEYHGWGRYEWDPLKIATRYPDALPWFREAELKHGRVAMLAWLGLVVPDYVRIPLPELEDPSLDMLTAHNKLIYGLGQGPMWWLLVFCGVIESLRFRDLGLAFEKLTLDNAGDLNFGKGFLPKTEDGQIQMKIKELKNGRLAMLAVSGALTQGILWNQHHFPFA